MDAARTALAPPLTIPSLMCSKVPTPPEATTGIFKLFVMLFVSCKSYPDFVPSLSIEVSKISPAPLFSANKANSKASSPVDSLPP